MSIHTASLKGRREQNEDRHKIFTNLDKSNIEKAPVDFYAIFDGHGGKFVSKFLCDHLCNFFIDKKIEYPLKKTYINRVYSYVQNTLSKDHVQNATNVGSTSLVAIRYKQGTRDYLNILNTGDSRCIICRNNLAIALTKDHKPNWPEENQRIKTLGGQIIFDGFDFRINDLSVSRAFGDLSAQQFVSFLPDVFRYRLVPDDKFIVLACDGLWDVLSNQDVVNFVLENCYDNTLNNRINKNINVAKKLAEFAIIRGSNDNVSVVVVFFK